MIRDAIFIDTDGIKSGVFLMKKTKLIIAEINTWVWLNDLEKKYMKPVNLGEVPEQEWDLLADMGFNAVWLMGVWKRSPSGKKISQENVDLYEEYSRSLPDWVPQDLPGSPYCVLDYSVDNRLGGIQGLRKARKTLKSRGIKLFLDFVPNHVSIDHNWLTGNPEFFVHGDEVDLARAPREFFQNSTGIFAKGRDPFFPPWQDVAQLNAFSLEYRKTASHVLEKIGSMCDGVRCDMAMLMLNRVFSYTWQSRARIPGETEFWDDVISSVHKKHPDMLFIAEVYWGLEWDLMQTGFDYCYDKRLYDRVIHESADMVRQHLKSEFGFQSKLLRFLENHDENRLSALLPLDRLCAATVLITTLPGALLLYEGQWDGRKQRNHVLLGRRQDEPIDNEVREFYKKIIEISGRIPANGTWFLCPVSTWVDNRTGEDIISYCWEDGNRKFIIIVNYSNHASQGRIMVLWENLIEYELELHDLLSNEVLHRKGGDVIRDGLFVNLPPWGYHLFYTEL